MSDSMLNLKTEYCDLHTHSTYSDGTFTPAQLIENAEAIGLTAIALCDHNNVSGLPDFFKAAENKNVDAVGGVEITTEYNKKELHIVGLFIENRPYPQLNELLENIQLRKETANYQMYKNLKNGGYNISFKNIQKQKNRGTVNRVQFANELMRCSYVKSIKEAFDTILNEKGEFYVPTKRDDAIDIIKLLSSLSIVPVLAHPFLNLQGDELKEFLALAKANGLVAMETNYSKFDKKQMQDAIALAKEFSLLKSGGSDFHGDNKPFIQLGIGKGDLLVPASYYYELKKFKMNI